MDLKLLCKHSNAEKKVNAFSVLILELIFKNLVEADFLMRMEEKCLTSKLGHKSYLMAAYQFSCHVCLFLFKLNY